MTTAEKVQLKLAKEETNRERQKELIELARTVINAPGIQLCLVVMLVEVAQQIRFDGTHQLISDNWGSAIEATITGGTLLSSLGGISGLSSLLSAFIK
jgi:hypothetical protein